MSLLTIFLGLFYGLGVLLGPLLIAVATKAYSRDRGRNIGDWSIGLGLKSVWRPSLAFNAADELTLKRRGYDEQHDEQKIVFGGLLNRVERFLFDPLNRIHDWYGTPFTFVDERFGICIDPRDPVIGRELRTAQEAGIYERRVERGQRLVESVLAVFELPRGHVGARLPDVWRLVGGSFDAQIVNHLHEYYQKSQAPKAQTTALKQLLVPVGAFIAVVLMGMFIAGQGAAGGGGGGGSPTGNVTNVNIGVALLLAAPSIEALRRRLSGISLPTPSLPQRSGGGGGSDGPSRSRLPSRAAVRDALVTVVFLGLFAGLAYGLWLFFPTYVALLAIPLPLGVWAIVMLGLGMLTVPVVAAWLGRTLGPIGVLLGKLFLTIGLLPYARPVLTLTESERYDVQEYDAREWPIEPKWYRFALTRLGIGFENGLEVWGEHAAETPNRVNALGSVEFDGGESPLATAAEAPPGHAISPLLERDGIQGYVPTDVDDDAVYVRSDLTTGGFLEAGQNRRLMLAALEYAKEKYGGGVKPVDDKYILGASLASMILGAVFDWLVFFS